MHLLKHFKNLLSVKRVKGDLIEEFQKFDYILQCQCLIKENQNNHWDKKYKLNRRCTMALGTGISIIS